MTSRRQTCWAKPARHAGVVHPRLWRGRSSRHVIDLFIEDRAERYAAEARLLLDGWAASTMGLWRVLSLDGSAQVSLIDLLREEPLEVYSPMLAHHARVGDLVMGRRVLAGETYLLAAMASLLPAEYEQPLGDYVRNAERLYREEHYQATWDAFLRANGHLFNAFMLSARADGLRSLIGAGTRYRDPAEARDRLRARTAELQAEAQRKARQAEQTRSGIRQTLQADCARRAHANEQDEAPRPRILLPAAIDNTPLQGLCQAMIRACCWAWMTLLINDWDAFFRPIWSCWCATWRWCRRRATAAFDAGTRHDAQQRLAGTLDRVFMSAFLSKTGCDAAGVDAHRVYARVRPTAVVHT